MPRVPADVCDHGGFLNVAEEVGCVDVGSYLAAWNSCACQLAQAVGSVLSAGNNEGTSRMVERAR